MLAGTRRLLQKTINLKTSDSGAETTKLMFRRPLSLLISFGKTASLLLCKGEKRSVQSDLL